jgi:polyisoprenoid-binding protein YceI
MTVTPPPPRASDARELQTARWRIDPARSRVEFRTPTFWGLVRVSGRFERFDGTLDLRRNPAIELTIEAASVNTKNKFRDRHLRTEDFFDVERHPEVRFVSDDATLDGTRLRVRGRLFAAGASIPLALDALVRRDGDELEIDATTQADHRDLRMSAGQLGMMRRPSELTVHARLVRDG